MLSQMGTAPLLNLSVWSCLPSVFRVVTFRNVTAVWSSIIEDEQFQGLVQLSGCASVIV